MNESELYDQASRAAKNMVVRLMLTELMVSLCMATADPVAEVRRRKDLNLGAMDKLLDDDASNELFQHLALHEMETLWTNIEKQVQGRVAAGLS